MNDDGTTMNLAQCRSFARTKAMSIINIDQLVRYLKANPSATSTTAGVPQIKKESGMSESVGEAQRTNTPELSPAKLQPGTVFLQASCSIPVIRYGVKLGKWEMRIFRNPDISAAEGSET